MTLTITARAGETLTGRRRFVSRVVRSNRFMGARQTVLVLQVERSWRETIWMGSAHTELRTGWRDAHTGDLTVTVVAEL